MEQATTDAVTSTVQTGGSWGMILYCVVVFGIIYLLIVRPNKRRMAEYQKMLDSLKIGDRVLAAGIYGVIKEIGEKTIKVEIAKGVVVEVAKNAVAGIEK